MYPVLVRHLRPDVQERVPVQPGRLAIHSTANPGGSDEMHYKWLDPERRHGWANYYLDWDSISQLVPEGMMAPAQGPTANADSISIELCEPALNVPYAEQAKLFNEVWERGVWLAADILFRYGWDMDKLQGHFQISAQYPNETNHTDPLAFFKRYGKTWADFETAVRRALYVMRVKFPEAQPWQYEAVKALQDVGLLRDLRHPRKPVEWWELAFMLQRVMEKKGGGS